MGYGKKSFLDKLTPLHNTPILHVPMGIVRLIGEINEYKGKQEMFRQQSPQVLDALKQVAVIQSTEFSNAIEGITVKASRLNPASAI